MDNQHQVFEFGGQEFVSGLFWQTATSVKGWKSEAKAQVRFQFKDMDLVTFCQLKDPFGIPQIGFGSSAAGAKPGANSIAAAIARAVAVRSNLSNWMGIFPVEGDFYVFVAVLKDALLPEGDFAGMRSEVLERFGQEFGQTNQWEAIYAPKALQIGNSEELSLDELFNFRSGKLKLKDPCKLQRVSDRLTPKHLVLGGVAAALAAAGIYVALNPALLTGSMGHVSPMPDVAKVIEPIRGEEPPIILPPPWKTEPEAAQVALACLQEIQRIPDGPGGWSLESVECSPRGARFVWQRGASNVAFVRTTIPSIVLEPTGDKASLEVPRSLPLPYEGEPVSVMTEGRLALISVAQGSGLQGTFTDLPESTTKDEKGRTVIKSWKNLTFSLTGPVTPWHFVTLTSHIHGLRLHKATRTGDQWKLEGDIYGK